MKKLLYILLLLSPVFAVAQKTPIFSNYKNIGNKNETARAQGGLSADSNFQPPVRDTNYLPLRAGAIVFRNQSWYGWDGVTWKRMSTDTIGSGVQVPSDWNATTGVSRILNKPSLATVATTGSYTDLVNKPTIPAAQIQSDWNSISGLSEILNKPTFAAVAISGSYADLTNTPRYVDTVTISGSTLGFTINGTPYSLSLPAGSGGVNNTGSAYRWVKGDHISIRSLRNGSGIMPLDSTSNSGELLIKADTSLLATLFYVNNQGFLKTNQTITLGQDLSGSGSTTINATIVAGAVTYAKIQNETAGTFLGRFAGTNGPPQELTVGSGLTTSGLVLIADTTLLSTHNYVNTRGFITGANNGLTLNGLTTVLGQPIGQPGDPAALLNIREIPLATFALVFKGTGDSIGIYPTQLKVGSFNFNSFASATNAKIMTDGEVRAAGGFNARAPFNDNIFSGMNVNTNGTGGTLQFTVGNALIQGMTHNSVSGNVISYTSIFNDATGATGTLNFQDYSGVSVATPSGGTANTTVNIIDMNPVLNPLGSFNGRINLLNFNPTFSTGIVKDLVAINIGSNGGKVLIADTVKLTNLTTVANDTSLYYSVVVNKSTGQLYKSAVTGSGGGIIDSAVIAGIGIKITRVGTQRIVSIDTLAFVDSIFVKQVGTGLNSVYAAGYDSIYNKAFVSGNGISVVQNPDSTIGWSLGQPIGDGQSPILTYLQGDRQIPLAAGSLFFSYLSGGNGIIIGDTVNHTGDALQVIGNEYIKGNLSIDTGNIYINQGILTVANNNISSVFNIQGDRDGYLRFTMNNFHTSFNAAVGFLVDNDLGLGLQVIVGSSTYNTSNITNSTSLISSATNGLYIASNSGPIFFTDNTSPFAPVVHGAILKNGRWSIYNGVYTSVPDVGRMFQVQGSAYISDSVLLAKTIVGSSSDSLFTKGVNGVVHTTPFSSYITGGVYSTTASTTTNISTVSITSINYDYNIITNEVTVSIGGSVTPTSASTNSTITVTLPVNTSTTSQNNCGNGTVAINTGSFQSVGMIANIVSASTATLNFWTPASGNVSSNFNVIFKYHTN